MTVNGHSVDPELLRAISDVLKDRLAANAAAGADVVELEAPKPAPLRFQIERPRIDNHLDATPIAEAVERLAGIVENERAESNASLVSALVAVTNAQEEANAALSSALGGLKDVLVGMFSRLSEALETQVEMTRQLVVGLSQRPPQRVLVKPADVSFPERGLRELTIVHDDGTRSVATERLLPVAEPRGTF